MQKQIDWKKIGYYLALLFFLSWVPVMILTLTGVRNGFSSFFISIFYIFTPAISAIIVQNYIYRDSMKKYGLWYEKGNLKWFLHIPLFFVLICLLAFGTIGLFGNVLHLDFFGMIDFSKDNLSIHFNEFLTGLPESLKDQYIQALEIISPFSFLVIFLISSIAAGSTVGLVTAFGEELGWRGLFLGETRNMGFLSSSLMTGVIWGIWQIPLMFIGEKKDDLFISIIVLILFCITISPVLTYIRLKTKSILGSSALHGMISSSSVIFILFINGYNPHFSSIIGVSGIIAGIIITIGIVLFDKEFIATFKEKNIPLLM